MHMHACIQTYIRTYMHAYIHTYIYSHTHTQVLDALSEGLGPRADHSPGTSASLVQLALRQKEQVSVCLSACRSVCTCTLTYTHVHAHKHTRICAPT